MGDLVPFPAPNRDVFIDGRGEGRVLRASWHHDEGMVVLSLWEWDHCRATFRLAPTDVPDMIALLAGGLPDHAGSPRAAAQPGGPEPHPAGPPFGQAPPPGPFPGGFPDRLPAQLPEPLTAQFAGRPPAPMPDRYAAPPAGPFPDQFAGPPPGPFPQQYPDGLPDQLAAQFAAQSPGPVSDQFTAQPPGPGPDQFTAQPPGPGPDQFAAQPRGPVSDQFTAQPRGPVSDQFTAQPPGPGPDQFATQPRGPGPDPYGAPPPPPGTFSGPPPQRAEAPFFTAGGFQTELPPGYPPAPSYPRAEYPGADHLPPVGSAPPVGSWPDLPPEYRQDERAPRPDFGPDFGEPPGYPHLPPADPQRETPGSYAPAAHNDRGDLDRPADYLGPRTGFEFPAVGQQLGLEQFPPPGPPAGQPLGPVGDQPPDPFDRWPVAQPDHQPDRLAGSGYDRAAAHHPGGFEPALREDSRGGGSWGAGGTPPWESEPAAHPRDRAPDAAEESTQFHPGPDYDQATDYPSAADVAGDPRRQPAADYPPAPQFTAAERDGRLREDPFAYGDYPGRP